MTAATCIGRVGGLAVALGIGAALSSGMGAASADTGAAHSSNPSHAAAPNTARKMSAPAARATARPSAVVSSAHAAAATATRRDTVKGTPASSPSASAAGTARTSTPINPVVIVDRVVYTPLHTAAEGWIHSGVGQQIDGIINTIARSYAIGDGADGDQERLLADGQTEITGSMPVNTDGGLIANGEPIGASGLRQIHEIVRQLRGEAGDRQVPGNPKVGFTQLYGAPGTAAATILTT